MSVDVSILLPTKDRPDRLARSIPAILAQEGPSFEVIINNGGGAHEAMIDGRPACDDERITVIERSTPLSGALNHTASFAAGALLHVSCDDDVMQPGTLASAVEAGGEWSYGKMQYIQDDVLGAVAGGNPWPGTLSLLFANAVLFPTAFYSHALFDEVGGFDESLEYVADYELWGRLGARHAPVVRDHIDYHYELWAGQVTSQHPTEINAEADVLRARWRDIGVGNREGGA